MAKILLVGMGGFLGSILRYCLSDISQRLFPLSIFPIGTFLVNLLGCFFIGLLNGMVDIRGVFSPNVRLFLFIGLLGGFTTFSTFGYETFVLSRDGNLLVALANIGLQLFLGLTFVWLGYTLATG